MFLHDLFTIPAKHCTAWLLDCTHTHTAEVMTSKSESAVPSQTTQVHVSQQHHAF